MWCGFRPIRQASHLSIGCSDWNGQRYSKIISSGASEVAKQPSYASSSEARRSVAPGVSFFSIPENFRKKLRTYAMIGHLDPFFSFFTSKSYENSISELSELSELMIGPIFFVFYLKKLRKSNC